MRAKNGQEFSMIIKAGEVNIDVMEENVLYYYKDTGKVWMYCPCGCETIITIPTAHIGKYVHNIWEILGVTTGKISLSPSIINQPCGAHFIIIDGKLRWH